MVVIHQIATCTECDWEEQDYFTANKKAHKHKRETGHKIIIETGTFYTI